MLDINFSRTDISYCLVIHINNLFEGILDGFYDVIGVNLCLTIKEKVNAEPQGTKKQRRPWGHGLPHTVHPEVLGLRPGCSGCSSYNKINHLRVGNQLAKSSFGLQ